MNGNRIRRATAAAHSRSEGAQHVISPLNTATGATHSRWTPARLMPPLSEAQAVAIVPEWQKTNAPGLAGGAKVLRLLEVRSVRGVCSYQVALGDFLSPPHRRHVLVLMDGTLIAGDVAT